MAALSVEVCGLALHVPYFLHELLGDRARCRRRLTSRRHAMLPTLLLLPLATRNLRGHLRGCFPLSRLRSMAWATAAVWLQPAR